MGCGVVKYGVIDMNCGKLGVVWFGALKNDMLESLMVWYKVVL